MEHENVGMVSTEFTEEKKWRSKRRKFKIKFQNKMEDVWIS